MYKKKRILSEEELPVSDQVERLKLEKLENDRQFLFSKVEELKQIISQERKTQISLKEECDKRTAQFLKEKNNLMEEITNLKLAHKNAAQEKDMKIQELQSKTDAFQSYISDLELKVQENLRSAKAKNLNLDFQMPNVQNLTKNEESILLKQLSHNLNHVSQLEKEIMTLKKEIDHYKTLDLNLFKKQEEIASLNNQIAQLSSLRGELANLQVERGLLLQEKARWSKFCQEEEGIVDPVTLTRSLAQCRLELAELKQELGEERAEKVGRQGYITRLEEEVKKYSINIKELEGLNQNLEKQLKLQERGKKLAQRETEFLRMQLESFDLEQDLVGNGMDDKKNKRIKELESLLDNYKNELNSMVIKKEIKAEEVVHNSEIHSTHVSHIISELKNGGFFVLIIEISTLKLQKGMLEKQVNSFEAQVHELQRALGRGEADFSEQRVLMLKENPSAHADQARYEELVALRAENEALRSSISTLPAESVKIFELKISELQQDLFTKEKRMIRLKEVLNAQVQEFRASLCSILGFKVDMQPQGKLKLSSIYSSMWTLEFDTHGNFLGFFGAKTERIQDGISKYLERSHVPAFMAWLTLHLFESSD